MLRKILFVLAFWILTAAGVAVAADRLPTATLGGVLPLNAQNTLTDSFPCVGKLIEQSKRPPTLIVIRNFDDGTMPSSQNGPLNDRGYLSAQYAVANLGTEKVMATLAGDDAEHARAALKQRPDAKTIQVVTLDASFNAYDQRTEDRSRSVDFFLFKIGGGLARDKSFGALHLTGVISTNGIAAAGGAFRYKAILQNTGSRTNISVFSGDSDLGAAFARSSFQAVGDLEELLIDLAVLTTVRRIYGVDLAACLNRPDGADYAATGEAAFARLSRQETEDAITASLFKLGYLPRPVLGYPTPVSQALRRFQMNHRLPPDGQPNAPTYLALGRAALAGEGQPLPTAAFEIELGRALEMARTGARTPLARGGGGWLVVTRTYDNYQNLKRPCRAYRPMVMIGARAIAQPEQIACRLAQDVWATIS